MESFSFPCCNGIFCTCCGLNTSPHDQHEGFDFQHASQTPASSNNVHVIPDTSHSGRLRFGDTVTLIVLNENGNSTSSVIPKDFQLLVDSYFYYTNVYECIEQIRTKSNERKENVILISLGNEGEHVYKECRACRQFVAIFLLSASDNMKDSDSRIFTFDDVPGLLRSVEDYLQPLHRRLLALRFFDQQQRSIIDLSKEGARFMWIQLLLDVLKALPPDKRTMDEMLRKCEDYYADQKEVLKNIKKFRLEYKPEKAASWYTATSFVYRLLNKALRSEDVEGLRIFRCYVLDLCGQLETLRCKQQHTKPPLKRVFRGQRLTSGELNLLKAHKDNLISTNSFLSSSKEKEIAKLFMKSSDESRQAVLFLIDVDMSLKSTICADISEISDIGDECEVLFVLSAVFKVVDVRQSSHSHVTTHQPGDLSTSYWEVHLKMTDEGRERLNEYRKLLRTNDEEDDPQITFGRLEILMGEFSKAVKYFTILLAGIPEENVYDRSKICQLHGRALFRLSKYDEALEKLQEGIQILEEANIGRDDPTYLRGQFQIANVYVFKSEYDDAITLYTDILAKQRRVLRSDHQHIADTLSGLSWAHQKKGNLEEALKFDLDALKIKKSVMPDHHPLITEAYKSIGGIYSSLCRFADALENFNIGLQTSEKYLPPDHPTIAETLAEIGCAHDDLGNKEEATKNYERALNIREKNFPDGHASTANVLDSLGSLYRQRKQFDKALEYHHRAAQIRQRLLEPDHIDVAAGLHRLANVYLDKEENQEAIKLFEQACEMKKKHLDNGSVSVCRTQSCLATAYSQNGEHERAQQLFEKTLTSQKAAYPPNGEHLDVATTLHQMGDQLLRVERKDEALKCYHKCLKMKAKFLGETNPSVLDTKKKIEKLESDD